MDMEAIFLDKRFFMSNYVLRITIRMARNDKGADRYTFMTLASENQSWFPTTQITFPWFKTCEVIAACRSLHLEMIRNNLI